MVVPSERREPRFVFLSDQPSRNAGDRAAGRFAWRLDAANHRPLARATSVTASAEECRDDASTVRTHIGETETLLLADAGRGVWTWRADLAGVAVAVSAHAYLRRVECLRAHGQFIRALAAADPDSGVVRNFGARALSFFEVGAGATR